MSLIGGIISPQLEKTRDLRVKQQVLGLPEHKIMGDVVTHWGSTYLMISWILEQQHALSAVLAEDRERIGIECH